MKTLPSVEVCTPIDYFKRSKQGLLDAWFEVEGEGYAPDYQNVTGPFARSAYKALHHFKGSSVLDIGCNSGQNSLAVSFYAKSVTGCEVQEVAYRRAQKAKSFMSEEFDMSHVEFFNEDFSNKLEPNIDAIMACKVLYWVGDKNISILKAFLQNKSKFRMFIHTVPGREKVTTNSYNGMIEVEDVKEFLHDCGFAEVEEWDFVSSSGHRQVYLYAEKS